MSSTDNLPRPADSPCLKCASAGCTSITIGKGDNRTNTEYIDNPEIPFCITYNNGRFWPPIAWSKFDRLKWSGD